MKSKNIVSSRLCFQGNDMIKHGLSKFNLHHLRKIWMEFKTAVLTPKSGIQNLLKHLQLFA